MSEEIIVMIFNCYFLLCVYHVSDMLSAYVPHLYGQGDSRVCKWLQIQESQISRFPKKSGIGVSCRDKLFLLYSASTIGLEGVVRTFILITSLDRELGYFTLVTMSPLDLAVLFLPRVVIYFGQLGF